MMLMSSRGWRVCSVLMGAVALLGCNNAPPPPPPPPPPAPQVQPARSRPALERPAPRVDDREPSATDAPLPPTPDLALPPVRALPAIGGQGVDSQGAGVPAGIVPGGASLLGGKDANKGFGLGGLSMAGGGLGDSLGAAMPPLDVPEVRGLALRGKLGDAPKSRVAPSSQPAAQPSSQPTSQPTSRSAAAPPARDDERKDAPGERRPAAGNDASDTTTPPAERKLQPLPAVVAKVNNEPIDRATFKWAFTLHRKMWERQNGSLLAEMLPEFRKKVLSRAIDEHLVYQRALQEGVKLTPEDRQKGMRAFQAQLPPGTDIRSFFMQTGLSPGEGRQMLIRQLYLEKYKESLISGVNVTKKMIKEYYQKHVGVGKVRARHIVIGLPDSPSDDAIDAAKKKAMAVLALAQANDANFAALAKQYSSDPSAASGGSLGEVKAGDMLKAIDEVLFTLQTGQVGGPVQTPLGFHILKVDHRQVSRPFSHMQAEIMRILFQNKVMQLLEKEAKELRKEAQIEILVPWGKD